MTADLVARLESAADECAKDAPLLREAASALRGSGEAEPFAFVDVTRAYSELVFPRAARKGVRGNRQAARELPVGLHPLYLHPATPASAWRPKVEDFLRRLATLQPPNVLLQQITMLGEARDLLREAITPPTSTKGG